MIACHRYLLVAPVIAATFSGCGVWDAWTQRSYDEPVQTAARDDSPSSTRIQPGHSAPEVFNDNYDPYNGQYEPYGSQSRRFAPPPAPPVQSSDSTSSLDRPHAPSGTASEDRKLIRTSRTPRIFSPESVRSIYDRFRGSEGDPPQQEPVRREGPIALRQQLPSPTQPCGYNEEGEAIAGPVRLGIPETQEEPLESAAAPSRVPLASGLPPVMQACPSSYRHPMYADPTGLPYARR